MRIKHIIILLLILLCFEGFSQVKPFRFGVKLAPNISWISPESDGYQKEGSLPGFSWGFLADITLTENYFVKTGFSMDYINCKYSYPDEIILDDVTGVTTSGTSSRKLNLRYLELPLTLKMRTNQFGKSAFFGEIGFGASVNLKAQASDEFTPSDGGSSDESESDVKDEIAQFKGSLIAGAGLEYFIDTSTSFVVSLTFNNGLSNILTGENSVDNTLKQRAKLYYFQLNLGIMF